MKKNLKLKKYISVILPAVLCMSNINNVWAEQRVINIQIESNTALVNGEVVNLDIAPYLDSNNNTMISVKFVAEALNIPDEDVIYNELSRKFTINFNGEVLNFFIGDYNLYKTQADGITTIYTMQNNAVAEIIDDTIFIPIRSIAEVFDITVGWDDVTQMVTLTTGESDIISVNELNPLQESLVVQESLVTQENLLLQEGLLVKVGSEKTIEQSDPIRQYEEEVVKLINIERAKYELEPLVIYEPAMDLAREKSQHMVDNNYFSNINPDGTYMYKQLVNAFAQNISVNQNTPEDLVKKFMSSESDRVNILSEDFKGIGIGLAYGNNSSNYKKYWTQIYVVSVPTEEQVETLNQSATATSIVQTDLNTINNISNMSVAPQQTNKPISEQDYMNEVAGFLMQSLGENLLTQQAQLQQTNIISTGNERASAEQAINLINAERTKVGLEPLKIFEPAMSIAQERAQDMNARNYMTTLSPEGVSLNDIITQKYAQRTSSNVANYITTPQGALESWMSFTPNNLLSSDYEYIGLGYSNSRWSYVLLGKMYNN